MSGPDSKLTSFCVQLKETEEIGLQGLRGVNPC